jgi:hypothetical protein
VQTRVGLEQRLLPRLSLGINLSVVKCEDLGREQKELAVRDGHECNSSARFVFIDDADGYE